MKGAHSEHTERSRCVMKHVPFCPVTSQEIMDVILNRLRKADVFSRASSEEICQFAEDLKALLPERYFPDVFLDLSMIGETCEGAAAVFDCYDRCFVNTDSEGDYFRRIHTDARCNLEDRDRLLILKEDNAGLSAVFEELDFKPVSSFADLYEGLSDLSSLPVSAYRKAQDDGDCLILRAKPDIVGNGLLREDLKEGIVRILKEAGGREELLARLEDVTLVCGVPYKEENGKSREWMVCVSLAAGMMAPEKLRGFLYLKHERFAEASEEFKAFSSLIESKTAQLYRHHAA